MMFLAFPPHFFFKLDSPIIRVFVHHIYAGSSPPMNNYDKWEKWGGGGVGQMCA